MKAVLISIKPKWCELIANGKKTVEVRKDKPKIDVPFKCYIYCTQNGNNLVKDDISTTISFIAKNSGKLIGEFICDRIDEFVFHRDFISDKMADIGMRARLYPYELCEYFKTTRNGYAWNISDLVIYDEPKCLREFIKHGFDKPIPVTRPPQSWMYVEVDANV